jgi:hypothetical protein
MAVRDRPAPAKTPVPPGSSGSSSTSASPGQARPGTRGVHHDAGGEGATAPAPDQAVAAAAGGPPGRVERTEFVPTGGGARFDPAVLPRMEGALAHSLSPVARILVREAAKTASDVPTLCQRLDVGLPEAQRAEFPRRRGDVASPPPAPP